MRTRRESAEEKRKAEEEIKRVKEAKEMRKKFAPRKGNRIGSYDIIVDPKLPKIYLHPESIGEPVEVKDENKEEPVEEDEVIGGHDEVEVIQQDEKEDVGVIEVIPLEDSIAEKVLLLVLPYLQEKDVFSCRRLNKQWHGMVDNFIEETVVAGPYDDEAYLKKVTRSPDQLCPLPKFRVVKYAAYEFEEEEKLINFNDLMEGHMDSGLGPFVGGATVTLNLDHLFFNGFSELSPATKLFLEKFGVHIRRLEIIVKCFLKPDIVRFVKFVKTCLHHVPNLERLKIGNTFRDDGSIMNDVKLELYRDELSDRMPKLDKLDTLEFDYSGLLVGVRRLSDSTNCPTPYCPYMEEIFGDIMINPYYRSQLKRLELTLCYANNLTIRLDNAKELSLVNLQCNLNEIKVEAPVEKLTLDSKFRFNVDQDVLVNLSNNFPHLRNLCIDRESLLKSFRDKILPLNNVHTLEIIDFPDEFHILEDIGHAFPNLRFLIFRNRENVALHYVLSGMQTEIPSTYKTVLWETLPKLEVFTFQFQDHSGNTDDSKYKLNICICYMLKGTKAECPFKNVFETRECYQRYRRDQ